VIELVGGLPDSVRVRSFERIAVVTDIRARDFETERRTDG